MTLGITPPPGEGIFRARFLHHEDGGLVNPFGTAVPFWGTNHLESELSCPQNGE